MADPTFESGTPQPESAHTGTAAPPHVEGEQYPQEPPFEMPPQPDLSSLIGTFVLFDNEKRLVAGRIIDWARSDNTLKVRTEKDTFSLRVGQDNITVLGGGQSPRETYKAAEAALILNDDLHQLMHVSQQALQAGAATGARVDLDVDGRSLSLDPAYAAQVLADMTLHTKLRVLTSVVELLNNV